MRKNIPTSEQALGMSTMPEEKTGRNEETGGRTGQSNLRNFDGDVPAPFRSISREGPGGRLRFGSSRKTVSSRKRLPHADSASPSDNTSIIEDRSAAAVAAAATNLGDKPETTKPSVPFRRIRGLLNGESRRRRLKLNSISSQRSIAEEGIKEEKDEVSGDVHADAPVSIVGSNQDDVSNIYDVTIDERSTATPARAPQDDDEFVLRMVLLLMDTTSQRFELLQMEFDPDRALVSDVLEQIPYSVTIPCLQDCAFERIITVHGDEKDRNTQLATFCKGNDILLAVPITLPAQETTRFAHQILSNPKIATVLVSCGVDVPVMAYDLDPKSRNEPDRSKKPVRSGGSLVLVAMILATTVLFAGYLRLSGINPSQLKIFKQRAPS